MRFDITRASCVLAITLMASCGGAAVDQASQGTGVDGAWKTPPGAQASLNVQFALSGTALSGSGAITVPPIAPATGPATPAYTGDAFTITSGNFSTPNVTFAATLGANPDGAGGFYHGTLSFFGTLNGSTISGTVTFTPPRTVSQTFGPQTIATATLTRP